MFSRQPAAGEGFIQNKVKPILIRERESWYHMLDKVTRGGKVRPLPFSLGEMGAIRGFEQGVI